MLLEAAAVLAGLALLYANIALILGLSAILRPLAVNVRIVQVNVPLMALVTLAVIVMLVDQGRGRVHGCW